jgi:cysteine-rich repeat protein
MFHHRKAILISMIGQCTRDRSEEVAMKRRYRFVMVCCALVFLVGIWGVSEAQGRIYYECGNGYQYPTCEDHGGYQCKEGNKKGKKKVGKKLTDCLDYGGAIWENRAPYCGDGWIEGIEECDHGARNSDSLPDACRTDCRRAHCRDNVVDSGEDCDDGPANSNIVPNACRTNCRFPSCGDGVHDFNYGEECDDGNQDGSDGCRPDCRTCTRLTGNVFVNTETFFLCKGGYSVASYPDAGAIIVQNENYVPVIDCAGATLQGSGAGAGIFVRNTSATIRNCTITGYAAGIRAVNAHVVIEASNHLTGNTRGVVLENSTRSDSKVATPTTGMPKDVAKGMSPGSQTESGGTAPVLLATPGLKPTLPQTLLPGSATGPAIASPNENQVFTSPAGFQATIAGDTRERVIFTIKSTDGGRFRAQSRNGSFSGIPAGDYCLEAAYLKTPGSPGRCVPFRVAGATSPPLRARSEMPAAPPSPARPESPTTGARPSLTVDKPVLAVAPSATVVTEGKRVFLNLNVAVARAEVYAGNRLVGRLPGGNRLEITNHVPNAVRGALILHYFDARGTKTVQTVQVGPGRR